MIEQQLETVELLTNSRIQTAKTCLKKHWFSYELRMRPVRTADALSRGSAFHMALEAYDLAEGFPDQKKAAGVEILAKRYAKVPTWCSSAEDLHMWQCEGAKMSALYVAHCDYWCNDSLDVVETEQGYDLPLINPSTGHPARNFRQGGKIDRIVRLFDGRLAVQEYKTTSENVDPSSDYWKRLRIDSQLSGYVLAARALGYAVETCLYDVTRIPNLAPYRATSMDSRKYKKDGSLYANMRDRDETPEEFGKRIYATVAANPQIFFRREEIARTDSDLREHQHDVWAWQRLIRESQNTGRWPRNSGACTHFGTKCPYFELCTSGWTADGACGVVPEGFQVLETQHPELTHPAA